MKLKLCACVALGVLFVLADIEVAVAAPHALVVTSPALKDGAAIPNVHSPDGRNDSPAINWSNIPAGTQEFAVVCEDPDAGNPPPFVHWVVYSIPATALGLPVALPIDGSPLPNDIAGAVQGLSGFRRAIYRGPAPPPGKVHHYHFIVYALDTRIVTRADQPPLTRAQLLEAMQGHVIGQGEIVATYERK
jgi:Raf kinase inhibitor-like YbhB/YbcL family protein